MDDVTKKIMQPILDSICPPKTGERWRFERENHGVSNRPAFGLTNMEGRGVGVQIKGGYEDEETIRKGVLVAAAPELYEALIDCVTVLDVVLSEIKNQPTTEAVRDRANEAIKKAGVVK